MNAEFIHPDLSDSLKPHERVALVRVMEEAAELQKEAAKALRFGLRNRYPADGPTNVQKMWSEYGDIRLALEALYPVTVPVGGAHPGGSDG